MKYFYIILFLTGFNSFTQINLQTWDLKGCPGEPDTLIAVGDTTYVWYLTDQPDSILSTSDTLIISVPGSFINPHITIASPSDTLNFQYFATASNCYCQCYVPNRFTPDGDLFNEEFFPVVYCGDVQGIRMTICNRMGKVVFDQTSLDWPRWDGTDQISGQMVRDDMYGWRVSFIKENGEIEHYSGFVTLGK